jgi:apolipoprotein D and lipocalin family protein
MAPWFRVMVLAGLGAALSACATLSPPPVGNRNVPQPLKSVEIDRYLGRWYELFRYDATFLKDCEAVSADYSLRPNGSIRVLNACHKGAVDGPLKTATGKAKIVDQATSAKLKVSFFGPFYGDYWILDRDDDYQWAIVGEPSGRYLWVLSRDPMPSKDRNDFLRRRVEELGYDWSLVRETRHPRSTLLTE